MKKIRARTGTILVSMMSQDTTEDGKHSIDPETGLVLGREVHQPIGVVVASGVKEIPVGCKAVIVCDLGEQYRFQGMKVQLARVYNSCKCGRAIPTNNDVAAIKVDGTWADPPGRRVLVPEATTPVSDVIAAPADRNATPEGVHEATGELLVYKNDHAFEWVDGGKRYVSVRETVPCRCGRIREGDLLGVREAAPEDEEA